jgi:hypothetical protein
MRRILVVWSLLIITLGSTGCIRYSYRVDMESEQDLARVRAAQNIMARELVVSFHPPAEWEYPEDRWVVIDADLKQWYAGWIVNRLKTPEREVAMIELGEIVENGIVLEVDLTEIDKGEHGWTGMGFGMKTSEVGYATIVFRDGTSGELLYQSEISMKSSVGSSDGGLGFRDRVKFLMWHCANSIRDLMAQGTLGEGMRNQDGPI